MKSRSVSPAGAFAPAVAIVGRLSYLKKFALIGVIMLVPLIWVVRAYVEVQNSGVEFADQERIGLTYVKPVTALLFDVISARTVAVDAAAGQAPEPAVTAEKQRIAQGIGSVQAAEPAAAALGLRSQWAATRRTLETLLARPSASADAALQSYDAMATAVENLIAEDGNNSNMILDPDNDSYYLMDAVLNRLPALADSAGQGADLQTAISASGQPTLARRLSLEDLKGTIETTLSNSDPDYASAFQNTHDTTMKPALAPGVTRVDAALAAVTNQISSAVAGSLQPAQARGLAARASAASLGLDRATFPVIALLLQRRIDGFDAASTTTELIALLGVLLAAYLFVGFYLSVRRSQGAIRGGLATLQDQCIDPLAASLDAMATGDLTARLDPAAPKIEGRTRDELGEIAASIDTIRERILGSINAFNAMCGELRHMVGDLTSAADSVGSASREVSSATQEAGRATGEIAVTATEVAGGAQRQARMLSEALGMADAVTEAARASVDSARETADSGELARREAGDGVAMAEQADAAMRAVRDSSAAVTSAITELATTSSQIDAIMGTIIAIAEQTNLLALNAAIEAARAGDHGRGFAVVADEVRELAEESRRAAGQINDLIRTVHDGTRHAVAVVEDGARSTEEGVDIVGRTKEAFGRIDAAVQSMTARVEEIAGASGGILTSATRMHATIGEIASVAAASSASSQQVTASTEATSAVTEEIAASAHELAGTAGSLEELVSRFRIE